MHIPCLLLCMTNGGCSPVRSNSAGPSRRCELGGGGFGKRASKGWTSFCPTEIRSQQMFGKTRVVRWILPTFYVTSRLWSDP